jgi:hypothetical protein
VHDHARRRLRPPDRRRRHVLSGGTDDRANITQTQVDAALANLFLDLGPGQVASPNWQTSTAHLSLLSHAANYGRFALCDPVDTTTLST